MATAFYVRDTIMPFDNSEPYYQTGAKVATCAKQPPEDDGLGADPSHPVPAAAGAAAPEHATDKDAGMMEPRGLHPLVDSFDDIAPFYPDTVEPGV